MSLDGSRVYEWSEFREQEFNRQIKEHASTWPAVSVVDWNGDGDDDVMIATDYLYFGFVERSYLEHGYAFGY
jgi:hypothetical protein